jgi:hypothetical protein
MTRRFTEPKEIKVRTSINGIPVSIVRNGRSERVARVYKQWRASDDWWGKETERHYFTIGTKNGLVCDVFRDTGDNRWFLSNIHD